MKTLEELKEYLCDVGCEEAIIFDDFSEAFVGVSQDCRAIYDFYKMVESYCIHNPESTIDEAIDYIDYNFLSYHNSLNELTPIILFGVEK